ncbi:AAA family ATPase [Solirubrobacter ginsenosidimutans]|uniref:AAA family ATPase n=1 Tax=Solirubrobacter ginsenosidimutans TaxID=490573 RepID=A0A9X3MXK8_9ACTN|nr:LuxR family transcriptional regulator [Solirubrobacter ginsenosidimutans]MDA0164397.1 AAA family ATPase [Solirubrobacter ginsenosidimutans]
MATRRAPVLLGRAAERQMLDRMLHNVRGGQSAVLVIRGEAGIGKTALLDYCASQASAFRTARIAGVEAEMDLPFAAVHQLCAPMLVRLDTLPEPQREALSVALGLSSGEPRDNFLVALAVLSLLAAVAEERPLLCVVDDAQWLDRASSQILGFVARRLLAESVALVFGVRKRSGTPALEGLAELRLRGLGSEDARVLLATAVPGLRDDRVCERIIAETRGNPLALLELSRHRSAPGVASGLVVPAAADLASRIEQRYCKRLHALPEATQRLLLLAAAEPAGDTTLLWRAAERLGLGASDLYPARESALLQISADVRFPHPLVRSAVYGEASPEDRRGAHAALADACDADVDADRRAWHRALAAAGPDEDVATELEHSAGRAQLRGGLAVAATVLERSMDLTPDAARRSRRALAAAEATLLSGAPEAALRLLGRAQAGPLDARERAHVELLRGRAAFGSLNRRDAPRLLLAAAKELEPLDRLSARDAYLEAMAAALYVGRHAGEIGVVEVAQAVRAASMDSGRPQDLLLGGLAVQITDGYRAGAPLVKRAVTAFRRADMPAPDAIRWLWMAAYAAQDVWDDEGWEELSERHVTLTRQAGALAMLPFALNGRVNLHLSAGELPAAASLIDELVAVKDAIGSGLPPYSALALAAFGGREDEAAKLIRAVREQVGARGEGIAMALLEHAEAMLYCALGRYPDACAAARHGLDRPHELSCLTRLLPQLVEAAVRSNQRALAEDAMRRLAESTSAAGTDWALGIEARSRALISEGEDAEPLYQDALERLGRTRLSAELARTHLLYGEWLRRLARRADAREPLRTAHHMFTEMGMEAFAERTRRELIATGETVRRRQPEARDDLTPQEGQIARLARDGLTNAEIGGQLFLSPRTVEWHLKKVFSKLGISSRRGLPEALPTRAADPAPV